MGVPVYTFFHMDSPTEQDLRLEIVQLKYGTEHHRFGDNGWSNVRVEHTVFPIEEYAVAHIQSRVTDMQSCCAVQYRVTPEGSNRLRGAQLNLVKMVKMLSGWGNQTRLEKKIAQQREKIVGIKLELSAKSTSTRWLVGGLLME